MMELLAERDSSTLPMLQFRLGIVGTRLVKDKELVKVIITHYIKRYVNNSLTVISGGAEGVDSIAEEVARSFNIPFIAYLPEGNKWGDFEKRNKLIVAECDVLLVIRYSESKTYGSGWTRDYAMKINKKVVSIEIEEV